MAIAIAFLVWFGAAMLLYLGLLFEPIYMVFYLLSSALLIFGKLQMYEGQRDLIVELFEDFYGWTTIVAMLMLMPLTFLIMEDE